jgi:hypothetical protein
MVAGNPTLSALSLRERVGVRGDTDWRRGLAGHHEEDDEAEDQHEGHDPIDLVLLGELPDLTEE